MHIHTYTCPSNPKVGKCRLVGGVSVGVARAHKQTQPTYTNQHRPVSPNQKLSVYRSMW